MNTLEMKGVILDKIAQIAEMGDPNVLMEVIDFLDSMLIMPDADSDGWSDLPPEAQAELLEAIQESESEDESLFVSHQELMEKSRSWLKNRGQ